MEQDKRVEDKKARFILLITQVVLWFMVMVMEMVVLIVKQINVSEHMLFLVSINLITIVTILINVHNYRKNKKRISILIFSLIFSFYLSFLYSMSENAI